MTTISSDGNDCRAPRRKASSIASTRLQRPASIAGWCQPAALCIHLCIGMAYVFSVFLAAAVARDRP